MANQERSINKLTSEATDAEIEIVVMAMRPSF